MTPCTRCRSWAINPTQHGRDDTRLDLCDVCFWRDRAEQAERAAETGVHLVNVLAAIDEEEEYPDAETYLPEVRADLVESGVSHPELVFEMLVFVARCAVRETKACIADRLVKRYAR